MNLHEKIHLHKVNRLEQLTPLELEQHQTNPSAKLAIKENQAFAELAALELAQPDRAKMMAAVFAPESQETWTPSAPKKTWWNTRHVMRWAVTATLVLTVTGVLVITPTPTHNGNGNMATIGSAQPAWASEPGLVMAYDAEAGSEEEALQLAEELTRKAQAAFVSHAEELARQEVLLNEAALALEKQRRLLGHNPPPRRVKLELSDSDRISLKKLHLNLTEVFEELELNSDGLELIHEKLALQEAAVTAMLQDLNSKKGNYYKLKRYAPKHEVRKLDNGNFSITVGFPGVEVAPENIAVNLSGVVNYQVNVSPAMFFVHQQNEPGSEAAPAQALENHVPLVSHTPHAQNVAGVSASLRKYEVHFSHGAHQANEAVGVRKVHKLLLHKLAPSPDAVRFGLAKSAFFGNPADGSLEILTSSEGDKLVVEIRREGELLHKIESNDLGEGMVYFGVPHLKHFGELNRVHKLHLEGIDNIGCVIQHSEGEGEANVEVELSLGAHGATGHAVSGHGSTIAFTSGDSVVALNQMGNLEALGLMSLEDLGGKIISILGDASDGHEMEVKTITKDGVKVVQILVDGEVTQEIHLKDGDVKVVLVEDEKTGEKK